MYIYVINIKRKDVTFMLINDSMPLWVEGLINTLLIIVLSSVIPLGIGCLFTFLSSINKVTYSIFNWLSFPTEVLCPLIITLILFYLPGYLFDGETLPRIACVIIAFSICFISYMPAHYNKDSSLLKNMLCNGFGLISTITKWSCIAGYISVIDLVNAAQKMLARTFDWTSMLIAFAVLTVLISVPELAKRLTKQFMK